MYSLIALSSAFLSVIILLVVSFFANLIPSGVEGRIYIFIASPVLGVLFSGVVFFIGKSQGFKKRYSISVLFSCVLSLLVHCSVISERAVPVSYLRDKGVVVENASVEDLIGFIFHTDPTIKSAALNRYRKLADNNHELYVEVMENLSDKYGDDYIDRDETVDIIISFSMTRDERALIYLKEMLKSKRKIKVNGLEGEVRTKYPTRDFALRLINQYYPDSEMSESANH